MNCHFAATALALASLAPAAAAQTPPAAAPAAAPAVAPAASAPAPDPARLAAARITIDAIFPAGTYARLMNGSFQQIIDQVSASMGDVPLRDLVAMAGVPKDKVARMGPGTVQQVNALLDPAHAERMHRMTGVMLGEMTKVMSAFEPELRVGMAEAYAARFSLEQLNDLNRFLATPSGQAYAANVMTVMMDPAVLGRMQALGPRLAQAMPAIAAAAQQANAGLPPIKRLKDLNPAERKRLAALLGVPEDALAKPAKP